MCNVIFVDHFPYLISDRIMSKGKGEGQTAAVVGAGLVGCLTAAMLAKQGWKVDLYESRAGDQLRSDEAATD